MRDRKLWMILERHAGHSLTVKARALPNEQVPNMRLTCENCATVLVDLPPPRSMKRAIVEKPDTLRARPPRPKHSEFNDDYFDRAGV
jgi:hypothetical protein